MTLEITKSPLLQQIDLQISDFLELKKFQRIKQPTLLLFDSITRNDCR